jgi:ammonium transporter, Amt family
MTGAPDSQFAYSVCFFSIVLVPFAIAGLALINTGLGRSRSAAHAMTSAVCMISVAMVIYFAFGSTIKESLYYSPAWGWTQCKTALPATGPFFRGLPWGTTASLPVLLMVFSVALCSLIPLGAAADRWRLGSACLSTAVLSGVLFPAFLRAMFDVYAGVRFPRVPLFLDAGGSGFINAVGGLTALAIAWLIGPRRGKYAANGMPAAIPAHNAIYVLFGCMLAWVGWLGLNSAAALLYAAMAPESSVLVAINTTFSAAAAGLTAAALTRVRFRRPDASLIANGWMAGLVASSAGSATLKPATAILTGLVAGALVVFSVEFFEFTLKVDDPCGSISVHAVCGIWGLLAVGVFTGSSGQFIAQLVGVATLLGLIFPTSYGLNWILNKFIPYRVSPDGERQGLDLHELGADAYPEFVIHSDEFIQR